MCKCLFASINIRKGNVSNFPLFVGHCKSKLYFKIDFSSTKAQKQLGNEPPIVNPPPTPIEWKGTEFPPADIPPILVNAPTFYPTEKEFQEPLEYIEKLTPLAQSFGICRIVPPSSFKVFLNTN